MIYNYLELLLDQQDELLNEITSLELLEQDKELLTATDKTFIAIQLKAMQIYNDCLEIRIGELLRNNNIEIE